MDYFLKNTQKVPNSFSYYELFVTFGTDIRSYVQWPLNRACALSFWQAAVR